MRLAQRYGVSRQRQGAALFLCDPPPAGAGLYAAIRDCGRRTRRGSAHDDQHRRLPANTGGAGSRYAGRGRVREDRRRDYAAAVQASEILIPGGAELMLDKALGPVLGLGFLVLAALP